MNTVTLAITLPLDGTAADRAAAFRAAIDAAYARGDSVSAYALSQILGDLKKPLTDVPSHLKTCKVGEPIEAALQWAKAWYMHAEVLFKCASCKMTYRNGDPCPAIRGGCPMGGDF